MIEFLWLFGELYLEVASIFFLVFFVVMVMNRRYEADGWLYTSAGSVILAIFWPFSFWEIHLFFKSRRDKDE